MVKKLRQVILVLGDIVFVFLSLLITVRLGFWNSFNWQVFLEHLLPFSFLYLCWLAIFYIFNLYNLSSAKPQLEFFTRTGQAFLVCLAVGIVFFYTLPYFDITPKTNLLINIVIFGLLFLGWRKLFFNLFSTFYLKNVAFLGKNNLAKSLAKKFKQHPQLGYKFTKFLEPKKSLPPQIRDQNIESIVITEQAYQNQKIIEKLYNLLPLKLNFMDLAGAFERLTHKIPVQFIDHNWFLKNLTEGEKRIYDRLKRLMDIVLAGIILIVTCPLWPFIALFIKMEDKGPVFYKQRRVGKNRTTFLLWKFRTMKQNAEKNGPQWAQKNDKRVTNVGRFLRRSHLDELPQMLNIIKGDIALVGPRPERPQFVKQLEKQIPHYHLRHIIKPGFTGWAQVNFGYARSLVDSTEKFRYDLYYLKNRNFILDLGILLRSFKLFFDVSHPER